MGTSLQPRDDGTLQRLYAWRSLVENALGKGISREDVQAALNERGYRSLGDLDRHIDLLERAQRPVRAVGRAEALVRGARQGVTFGFADELQGLIPGGETTEQAREGLALARRERPGAVMAGEIAGAALPALATGGALAGAAPASVLGGMAAGAAAGGLEGALGAVGRAEGTLPERILSPGTAEQALLGAATGMAFPVGGALVAPLTSRLRVPESIAVERALENLPRATRTGAPAELEALQTATAAPGFPSPARVADTEIGTAMARGAVMADIGGSRMVLQPLLDRLRSAGASLEGVLADVTQRGPRASIAEMETLARTARSQIGRAAFAPLEGLAPATPAQIATTMSWVEDFLKLPGARGIWNDVKQDAEWMGVTLRNVVGRNPKTGRFAVTGQVPDFLTLQTIQRTLRDRANVAFKAGAGGRGRAIRERADRLQQVIEDVYGDQYPQAQAAWANATRVVEAPRLAKKMWAGGDPRDVELWMASAPAEAREYLRVGAINELRRQLRQQRDPIGFLAQQQPEKLSLILSPDEMRRLQTALAGWQRMRMTGEVLRGSWTEANKNLTAMMGLERVQPSATTLLGTMREALFPRAVTGNQLRAARALARMAMEETVPRAVSRPALRVPYATLLRQPLAQTGFPLFQRRD